MEITVTTVTTNDRLLEKAKALTGISDHSVILNQALMALIQRESARKLADLGGSESDVKVIPR